MATTTSTGSGIAGACSVDGPAMHELPAHLQPFLDPAFYPHPVEKVDMLQTHISWVFLTGKLAYKVKKPVNFGFLDFSTLDKRHHYCNEELRLNQRLAPELYLEVLPVGRDEHGSRLGSETGIADYCLCMRQFSQADLLSHRLELGNFQDEWMDRIAADLAHFHASVATKASHRHGSPETLARHIRDNLAIAGEHIGRVVDGSQLQALENFADLELARLHDKLLQRQQAGFVRPCHGDLHLHNITLFEDTPLAFDCIEFSEEYRIIDTMNDVAFLVMDCEARGRPDLGLRFLSRYLEATGDYQGLKPLRLYLFYRATVRGKVATLSAGNAGISEAERQAYEADARRYFDLAARYAEPANPRLYGVGGLSGSGKSHLALKGCSRTNAVIIRSDATRKRIASKHADLPLYGDKMHRQTYEAMFAAARETLAAGWPVILDATFMDRSQRNNARQLAADAGVPLHLYWLDPPEALLRNRIQQRTLKRQDISDADLSVLEKQLTDYRRPEESDIAILTSSDDWPED